MELQPRTDGEVRSWPGDGPENPVAAPCPAFPSWGGCAARGAAQDFILSRTVALFQRVVCVYANICFSIYVL